MAKIVDEYKVLLRLLKPNIKADEQKIIRLSFNKLLEIYDKLNYEKEIIKSLKTAQIAVSEIGLETVSIVCIFLIEPFKKGKINNEEIEEKFGRKLLELLIEIEKISEIDLSKKSINSEYLNALLIAVSKDIRVILIKLAQHIYNIRNFSESLEEEKNEDNKKDRIISEAEYLFAPIAHKLGLYNIKHELEDLALQIKNPDIHQSIQQKIIETEQKRETFINNFLKPINKKLKTLSLNHKIVWRTKSISSIYRKMQKQNVEFEEVYDLFAIRVIIDSTEKSDCWKVYSIVSDLYIPNTNRLRDWISYPKSNGYESLHTTVMSKEGKWVEIQIRTKQMDEIAELGLAAHWKYKSKVQTTGLDNWIQKTREILSNHAFDNDEKIDSYKSELYGDEIFVFTPGGDLKKLPHGSTVLDFAFEVHTKIGETCLSAKINNKLVPLRHSLKNGDQVFILTSKNQKPREDWLKFVKTSKAKSKIKRILNDEKHKDALNGKEILNRKLKNWKLKFDDETISFLLKNLKLKNATDFYSAIAKGNIDIQNIKTILLNEKENENIVPSTIVKEENIVPKIEKEKDFLLIDGTVENVNYRFAKCCKPIFGDQVFGYITVGKGISIHRKNCPNAKNLELHNKLRIKAIKWKTTDTEAVFSTSIRIFGKDRIGMLEEITKLISSDMKLNMRNINLNSSRDGFDGTINLIVRSRSHLNVVIQKIRRLKGITKVVRTN